MATVATSFPPGLLYRFFLAQLQLLPLFILCATSAPAATEPGSRTAAEKRTLDSLQHIRTISPEEVARFSPRITALSYTQARAVRALCALPNLTPAQLPQLFDMPELAGISYSAVPVLERYVTLSGASLTGAGELLRQLHDLPFVSEQALAHLPDIRMERADSVLAMIQPLIRLDEAGRWAAGSLFQVRDIDAAAVLLSLEQIGRLSPAQKRCAEKALRVPGLTPGMVSGLLTRLAELAEPEAINVGGMLADPDLTAPILNGWLDRYFLLPGPEREQVYLSLPAADKTRLLGWLGEAAGSLAERLNNLHAVSDGLGREIGAARLAAMPPEEMLQLFARLDPVTRSHYGAAMHQALAGRSTAAGRVEILRLATLAARRQLARELTGENLYVLLSCGGESFDSSYRDYLVPAMTAKIRDRHHNDLLGFLSAADPESTLISSFFSHLAWKGSLTRFLPTDVALQQAILELLALSALRDEESLLTFAATFTPLLQALQPAARTALLRRLTEAAEKPGRFARQVRAILQEYLDHHSGLLSADDRKTIKGMLALRGRIDFAPYVEAPFARWLEDGRLTSLSVFEADDDGSVSYQAHGAYLLHRGYRPSLSREYGPGRLDAALQAEIAATLKALSAGRSDRLAALFRLAAGAPVVIDWQKRTGQVELTHAVSIFQGDSHQQQLLKTFLRSGHELLAQRGHSYWRNQQLFGPLEQLLERGEIEPSLLTDRQRFISIGSCGGIRTYGELIRRFGDRVDILATVGTGRSAINTPYNTRLLEIVADQSRQGKPLTWRDISAMTAAIFTAEGGGEYIQPGSLPAILYKMSVQ